MTDLHTDVMQGIVHQDVEVRCHDLVGDPVPVEAFDLIHARLILMYLPNRLEVLRRLVSALRPGGKLLIEDFDDTSWDPRPSSMTLAKVQAAVDRQFASLMDLTWASAVPGHLQKLGLGDIGGQATSRLLPGGSELVGILREVVELWRPHLVRAGDTTDVEVDSCLSAMMDPQRMLISGRLVSTWGSRQLAVHRTGNPTRQGS